MIFSEDTNNDVIIISNSIRSGDSNYDDRAVLVETQLQSVIIFRWCKQLYKTIFNSITREDSNY